MTEFELKLEIPEQHLARVVAAMEKGKCARQRLRARYFDTPEGALAHSGIVVRMRREGRSWVQTAKAPGKGPLARLEHNVPVAAAAGAAVAPAVDLLRHAADPVGLAIRKALDLAPGEAFPALVALYETDVLRLTRSARRGVSRMEVALDRGRIVAGERSLVLRELEVELKAGRPEDTVQLAAQWSMSHGLWLSNVSKSMKGQRLAKAQLSGPPSHARPADYGRDAGAVELVASIVGNCLEQILGNASEVAAGHGTDDHIHQLRVGIRRLRTALRELGDLTDGIEPAWEAPLVEAFRALGRHRDHSYIAGRLEPQLQAAGGPAVNPQRVGGDVPDPAEVVRASAFQAALLGLVAFAHRDGSEGRRFDAHRTRTQLAQRLAKLRKQVVRDGSRFASLDAIRQHRVRKRLKRLRYLAEFAAPLFKGRKTEAFADDLKPLQDALGTYNDELAALRAYLEIAPAEPSAWFAVGWLSARREPNARACEQSLQKFAEKKPFWD